MRKGGGISWKGPRRRDLILEGIHSAAVVVDDDVW